MWRRICKGLLESVRPCMLMRHRCVMIIVTRARALGHSRRRRRGGVLHWQPAATPANHRLRDTTNAAALPSSPWRRRKAAYIDTSQHVADSGGWLWRSCGCLRHGTSSRWRRRWPTGAVWSSSNAASLGTVPGGGRDGFVSEDDKGRAWTSS